MRSKLLAIIAAALLLSAAAAPTVAAEGDLSAAVEQAGDGDVTVTVTHDGTTVENASVVVEATDENATYAGEGNYTTDADGTVSLPAPDDPVNVTVTATTEDGKASTTAELQPPSVDVTVEQAADASATATITYAITDEPADGAAVNVTTVDANASYAGTGAYTADANGSVSLPAPDEPVSVRIAAEAGDLHDEETVTLDNASALREMRDLPFGAQVSAFVHGLRASFDGEGSFGQAVSEWVREHNPGESPEHAGPPEDGDRGKPAFAGTDDRVGGNGTDGETLTADRGSGGDDRGPADRGNGGGPPDDRGPNAEAGGHGR